MATIKFDLIRSLIKHLDPHLSIVLLEYYENSEHKVFNPDVLHREKLLVLIRTKIIDYIQQECDKINDPVTQKIKLEFEKIKEKTEIDAGNYLNSAENFINFFKEREPELEKEKFSKVAYNRIKEFENVKKSDIIETAKLARCLFDIGQYAQSLNFLNAIHCLIEDEEITLSVLWGKTLSEIVLKMTDEAKDDFKQLRQKIDNTTFKMNMQILANRGYLLHTSLFLYFSPKSTDSDFDSLIELYSNENNLNTIQMICPHLIRYLAACLLLSKNSQKYGNFNMNNFINLLQRETCEYSDSLTEFVKMVLINFDFKQGQALIKEIRKDFQNDYFLSHKVEAIVHSAQTILFEEYCKIHNLIEISMVSSYLEIPKEEAEIWIVNLIRNANIEAKIDSEKDIVVISRTRTNYYEEIAAKTRDLIPKTNLLINNIKRIFNTKV